MITIEHHPCAACAVQAPGLDAEALAARGCTLISVNGRVVAVHGAVVASSLRILRTGKGHILCGITNKIADADVYRSGGGYSPLAKAQGAAFIAPMWSHAQYVEQPDGRHPAPVAVYPVCLPQGSYGMAIARADGYIALRMYPDWRSAQLWGPFPEAQFFSAMPHGLFAVVGGHLYKWNQNLSRSVLEPWGVDALPGRVSDAGTAVGDVRVLGVHPVTGCTVVRVIGKEGADGKRRPRYAWGVNAETDGFVLGSPCSATPGAGKTRHILEQLGVPLLA